MTLEDVFKKYNDHHWLEEEASASNYSMGHWAACYLQHVDVFKTKKLFSMCFYLVDDTYLKEWSSREESEDVLNWLLATNRKNPKYLLQKDKDYQAVNKKIDDLFYFFRELDINTLSKKELVKYLKDLMSLGNLQFGYNLVAEAFDIVDNDYYDKLLNSVPIKQRAHLIEVLSKPEELGFVEKETLDLFKIAKKYYNNTKLKKYIKDLSLTKIKKEYPDFYTVLQKHQNNYFWIQNNYKEAKVLPIRYFLQDLANIFINNNLKNINSSINAAVNKQKNLSQERKTLIKKYKISEEAQNFFKVLRLLSIWQDRRKENIQKILASVEKILDRASQDHKIDKEVLRQYFTKDLVVLISKNKKVKVSELNKRKKQLFYSYLDRNNKVRQKIFYGNQIYKALKYFRRHTYVSKDRVSGFVASKGKTAKNIEGRVRIVLDANRDTFKKDEILVTGMTRPEFVPLMKKAKAIITNEGGITSHAAIISRELKIPCIIGTKLATEVFKDGDRVEMDVNEGVVKKI